LDGLEIMNALLLSGGMDSIAIAYWCRPDVAITVDYGQLPAAAEIRASAAVAEELSIRHEVIRVDMRELGSGDLAGRTALDLAPAREWWPYRNQMLVTLAAMRGISLGVSQLLIGTVLSDGFHTDGSLTFVESLNSLLAMQEGGMTLRAPSISMNTVELIRHSNTPEGLLGWSHSCHMSDMACGVCRGCCKHYNVTRDLGWSPH
jgi:7-cyano-7-deazaguanine synthase